MPVNWQGEKTEKNLINSETRVRQGDVPFVSLEEIVMNKAIHVVTRAFGYSGKCIARRLLDEGREVIT